MLSSKTTYVGIDPSGGHQPFLFAALDDNCRLTAQAAGDMVDVVAFLGSQEEILVAINAPHCPSKGLVRRKMEEKSPAPGYLRGTDMRMAEYELRQRGISIAPTPSKSENCPAWIQTGFDFYRKLEMLGYKPFPSEGTTRQWLETQPHAAFCTLLGQLPLPKLTLEGRLQRQLVLFEQDMGIHDPMELFEEITRHRLLKGLIPMEFVYSAEQLDVMVATFVAFVAGRHSSNLIWVGDKEEGQIALPVDGLKEVYL
jgi:hypothetical protein